MKTIKLTKGQVAIVDDEDYEYLSKFKWYASYYKSIDGYYAMRSSKKIYGKQHTIPMHRIIMRTPNNLQVDHIDHNPLDNRKCNLRNVTTSENHFNRKHQYEENCGYCWDKQRQQYDTRIGVNGQRIFLGLFNTPQEARAAYLAARKKYHVIGGENYT